MRWLSRGIGSPWRQETLGRLLDRDLELCRRAAKAQASRSSLAFFRFVSRAGDGACWFALAAGLLLWRGLDGLPLVARLSAVGILATLASRGLKQWVDRPRPCRVDPSIAAGCSPLDPWSFPSGHTLHAVAFQVVLIPGEPLVALGLVPWTLAIAASRVVLGLHYPSDVAGGAVVGGLLAGVVLAVV